MGQMRCDYTDSHMGNPTLDSLELGFNAFYISPTTPQSLKFGQSLTSQLGYSVWVGFCGYKDSPN